MLLPLIASEKKEKDFACSGLQPHRSEKDIKVTHVSASNNVAVANAQRNHAHVVITNNVTAHLRKFVNK